LYSLSDKDIGSVAVAPKLQRHFTLSLYSLSDKDIGSVAVAPTLQRHETLALQSRNKKICVVPKQLLILRHADTVNVWR